MNSNSPFRPPPPHSPRRLPLHLRVSLTVRWLSETRFPFPRLTTSAGASFWVGLQPGVKGFELLISYQPTGASAFHLGPWTEWGTWERRALGREHTTGDEIVICSLRQLLSLLPLRLPCMCSPGLPLGCQGQEAHLVVPVDNNRISMHLVMT